MKSTIWNAMAVMLMAAATATAACGDDKEKEPAAGPDVAAMMKEFAKPGPQHEQLKRLAGAWSTEVKSYFPNPDEPTISEGKARFTLMLDGRYLRQEFRSKMNGEDFVGIGVLGYDKAQQKYVGAWIDNHGTGIMHTEGTYDPKTHTMTETGSSMTPLGEMKMKMTSKYRDPNNFVFTMYALQGDDEQKVMEIEYTRAEPKEGRKKTPKE